MADNTTAYVYTGNKDPNDGTSQIVVQGTVSEPEKLLVVNGPPVELTEEEHAKASKRFNLRKASDKQVEAAEGEKSPEEQKAEAEKVLADNDNTSASLGGGGSGPAKGTADGTGSSQRTR